MMKVLLAASVVVLALAAPVLAQQITLDPPIPDAPEPGASLALLGLLAVGAILRRRKGVAAT